MKSDEPRMEPKTGQKKKRTEPKTLTWFCRGDSLILIPSYTDDLQGWKHSVK